MERQPTNNEIPKWSALLIEAVNKPGLMMEAYSAFHRYSIGNQILAFVQCQMRGLLSSSQFRYRPKIEKIGPRPHCRFQLH